MTDGQIVLVRILTLKRPNGYFHASTFNLTIGERCVVDNGGLRLGTVEGFLAAGQGVGEQLDRIVRLATPADLEAYEKNREDTEAVLTSTRETVAQHDLPMHLVAAEYTLDRSQLRIYFTAPHRVDFRSLLRELSARFGTRIELRQMGVRDEARLKGAIGRCGRIICCNGFLREPKPIPMELAYVQELFVSPERITGICGRLMCCLSYEYESYRQEMTKMPRLGTWVTYEGTQGKIISHNIFQHTVTILTDAEERIEADATRVKTLPPRKKGKKKEQDAPPPSSGG
jgi:cell fate regulator YaaT (PSP1 superfamily)